MNWDWLKSTAALQSRLGLIDPAGAAWMGHIGGAAGREKTCQGPTSALTHNDR